MYACKVALSQVHYHYNIIIFSVLIFVFSIPVRASDKHIAHQEEYSDSEDEGDNRRDIHLVKEPKRSRKRPKGSVMAIEKMVTNGTVENAVTNDDSKPSGNLSNENSSSKPSTSPVESEKEKPKSSSSTPKEGSPQTVASVTAEVSTEPAPEQEASRKRCSTFLTCIMIYHVRNDKISVYLILLYNIPQIFPSLTNHTVFRNALY